MSVVWVVAHSPGRAWVAESALLKQAAPALPSGILSELNGSHSDCFFTIAVNMNQAATPPVLDNLRFQ